MKKTSTVRVNGNMIFKGHKLTIGLDLGDRWSNYCVLDEAGEVLLEQKLATTPEAMKQTFEKIPRSLLAVETGTHSPWLNRLLKELGHEVLVAHAQKVELIAKKRAVVAVARKLAVLLHRLWVSGEVYEPLRNSHQAMRAVA